MGITKQQYDPYSYESCICNLSVWEHMRLHANADNNNLLPFESDLPRNDITNAFNQDADYYPAHIHDGL